MKKLIENINDMRKSLNEISVYDLNVYSAIELYYKLALKTNEVITELSRFEGVISDEIIEQNEKLTYLLGEGLNIEVVKKINQMIADGTMDTIINHNVFNGLSSKIDEIQKFSITSFPRLEGEEDDYNRFKRALSLINDGGVLELENEVYYFNNKSLELNKQIDIIGKRKPSYNNGKLSNGTILKDVKIVLHGTDYTVKNIGVDSPSIDNGFEANTGNCSKVTLKNCVTIANSHGYLFESYEGVVENNKIIGCESYGGVHGFISKAFNTKFIDCFAHGNSVYGFGCISDNIPSPNKIGNGSQSEFINCVAKDNAYGFAVYSRDMFSEDNSNKILLQDVKIINSKTFDCNTGINLGDKPLANTGNTYNTVYNVLIENFTQKHSNNSSNIRSLDLGRINGLIATGKVDSEINVNGHDISNIDLNILNNNVENNTIISNNNPMPSLKFFNKNLNIITFKNTSKTTINGFLGGSRDVNKILIIHIDDDYTKIINANNIKLRNEINGRGSFVVLRSDGENWTEVASNSTIKSNNFVQLDLSNAPKLSQSDGCLLEFIYNSDTTNKINVDNTFTTYQIVIRPVTAGTHSYGGFSNNVIANGVETSIPFGKALVLKLQWINSLNKFLVIEKYLSSVL